MKGMRILTDEVIDIIYGLSGVLLGAFVAGVVFFIQRHIGKKKHWFDERYWERANRAKARSWDSTLVILFFAWIVVIIYEGIGFSFYLVTGIYMLHNIALIIFNAYFSKQ